MPDYIYLLENRLSPGQQHALQVIREAARESGMTVFLTGGAVRDLTSGSPVRDLDLSVQGKVSELKPKLKQAGAVLWGEHTPSHTLFARFPGGVRVEVSSTRREEFPKPAKPVYHTGSILEDLRRRDFTANAMALSLNEGSYGLLLDPLNGVADLEARLLRLVSNYGFLEDPIRLIRAARLKARLGWDLEEKTQTRFENAKAEGVISLITPYQLGYEVEEIVHEEDGLKILKALEADGWMKVLFPAWTSAKVDAEALEAMREVLVQLQMQGVNPDQSAAQAQLLTAKLSFKDLTALKTMFARQGFVKEWESQEARAKEVGKRLIGKEAATPSATWKLLTSTDPEAVLWLGMTSKNAAVQQKFKDFFTLWPESRARIPYAIMQEMRITPELPGYQDLVKSIFFELIDGKLTTEEEIRQYLEPHSPPAPPPPVTIRRTRAKKGARSVEAREIDEDETPTPRPHGDEEGGDEEESESGDERVELIARSVLAPLPEPEVAAPPVIEAEAAPAPPTPAPKAARPAKFAAKAAPGAAQAPKSAVVPAPEPKPKPVPEPAAKPKPEKAVQAKAVQAKAVQARAVQARAVQVKTAPAVKGKPVPTHPVKAAAKVVPAKAAAKKPASRSAKVAPAKSAGARPARAVAKTAPKPAARSRPALKKPALKKAAMKPALSAKGVAKPRPAKAIVKSKSAAGKAKPAIKKKAVAKPVKKAVPAKKKR
jgi:tRNA nucleotidyltransferase (CCA-adding enzyme)